MARMFGERDAVGARLLVGFNLSEALSHRLAHSTEKGGALRACAFLHVLSGHSSWPTLEQFVFTC